MATCVTLYGEGRSSPRSFYAHHSAAISAAIVAHESLALENAAASVARSLLTCPTPTLGDFLPSHLTVISEHGSELGSSTPAP